MAHLGNFASRDWTEHIETIDVARRYPNVDLRPSHSVPQPRPRFLSSLLSAVGFQKRESMVVGVTRASLLNRTTGGREGLTRQFCIDLLDLRGKSFLTHVASDLGI